MNGKIAELGKRTNLSRADAKKLTKIGVTGLLALIFSVLSAGWSNAIAADNQPQPAKESAKPMSERCSMRHETGPCKANFERYYYDAETNKCRVFTYGGCEGVVPFESYRECARACVTGNGYMGHKYGGVGIRDFR